MKAPNSEDLALARLAKAESLAAEAQRIAGVGTWQYDAASGLVVWSAEMFRIFGVPQSFQPSFENFAACLHPDDREKMLSVIEATLAGDAMDTVHRIVRPDGEIRYIHARAQVVVLEKGHAAVLLGTAQDITERKKAEAMIASQTRQLKEMQAELIYVARQTAMGTMAATLAHELNQPLTAIGNYAAGLTRLVAKNPQADAGLKEIAKNTERAAQIIRRLREMTRRGGTKRARASLNEIIKEALWLVGQGACVDSQIEWRRGDDHFLEVDATQIGQVVINLVKNACEATDNQALKNITIETSDRADFVEVSVIDSGPGIAPEVVERLFESRTSTKTNGMGIGLSISRTIVENHGGHIGAENRAHGARFWFTLPIPTAITT